MKKGIALSLNVIILIAIGVLVIVALGLFFASSTGGQISEADAQRVFATGCARYCEPNLYQTFKNAYTASQNDPNFVKACNKLGYGDQQHVNRCLERCSNCNLQVDENDINSGLDNLNSLTTQ